jgi:hypothetical protein
MSYSILYLLSFFSSKFLGLDRTTLFFKTLGRFLQTFHSFSNDPKRISADLKRGLKYVPFAAKCLDQAIVAWFILNLHGHQAILKIGLSLSPIESHAWVEADNEIFVDTYNIPDLTVVAEYPAW